MNKALPKLLLLVLTAGLAAGCGEPEGTAAGGQAEPAVATVTETAPDPAALASTFQSLDGRPVELSDYAGRNVVLNYWATWCAPCIAEIPSLNRAAEILGSENYVFLLASDESLEDIRVFLDERDFDGNFIKLNGFFATQGVQAVPSTVLYNAQGEEVRSWLGEREWDSPEMLDELRDL